MALEIGLVAHLTADAGVSALIGSRLYAEQMPQNPTYPAVVYSRVSTTQGDLLNGADTLTAVRIQFDAYAVDYAGVKALATAFRAALNGFRGDLGGVAVQRVKLENETDLSNFDGDDMNRRVSMDYIFTLHE